MRLLSNNHIQQSIPKQDNPRTSADGEPIRKSEKPQPLSNTTMHSIMITGPPEYHPSIETLIGPASAAKTLRMNKKSISVDKT